MDNDNAEVGKRLEEIRERAEVITRLANNVAAVVLAGEDIPYLLSLNEALVERVKVLEYALTRIKAAQEGRGQEDGIWAIAKVALEQPHLTP